MNLSDIDGNFLEKSVEQRTIDAKDADIKAWLSTSPPAGRNMPAIEYDPQMENLGDGYSRPAQNAPYASSRSQINWYWWVHHTDCISWKVEATGK